MTRSQPTTVVLMTIAGAALISGCAGDLPPATASTIELPNADTVPGLGRSADAVLRDDTIAYWEAWKRSKITANCMRDAGFTWHLDVGYPQESIARVAESLGVRALSTTVTPSGEELNATSYEQMDARQQDAYSRALQGESAADMWELSRTGSVPEGRDDTFASGGCLGQAWNEVPGVWSLSREVGPEILDVELEIKESEFGEVRAAYANCAADVGLDGIDGPESIDQVLLDATNADTAVSPVELDSLVALADEVTTECGAIWATGSNEAYAHALSVVRARHGDLFDTHIRNYEAVLPEIRMDVEFLAFLSGEAGRPG